MDLIKLIIENVDINVIKNAINAGANVNLYRSQTTPLMEAVRYSRLDIVKELLQCLIIDINKSNKYGKTAIMISCNSFNNIDIFYELIKCPNIDINKKQIDGDTALMKACCGNSGYNVEMVNVLLKYPGIDVNCMDINGQTALVCMMGYSPEYITLKIAKILLEHGAKILILDDDGLSAIEHLEKNKKYYLNVYDELMTIFKKQLLIEYTEIFTFLPIDIVRTMMKFI